MENYLSFHIQKKCIYNDHTRSCYLGGEDIHISTMKTFKWVMLYLWIIRVVYQYHFDQDIVQTVLYIPLIQLEVEIYVHVKVCQQYSPVMNSVDRLVGEKFFGCFFSFITTQVNNCFHPLIIRMNTVILTYLIHLWR